MLPLIPYFSFNKINENVKDDVSEIIQEVYNSKWYILGQYVDSFEKKFAEYIGIDYAIGVGNGYDALKISLKALGIGQGDEVIIPAHTFIATILPVIQVGAKPILVDVDPESYNLNVANLEKYINNKTKAIIPVHLYGNPCEISEVNKIADLYKIPVIEDFAQAVGASVGNKKIGSFGRINASSFYPVKTFGALGDGGIITTNDPELNQLCRKLRNYGFASKFQHEIIGYNSRLDEIQAAILLKKLAWLDKWIEERRIITNQYTKRLELIDQITLTASLSNSNSSHHIFPIRCIRRNELKIHLEKNGIETSIHYPIPIYFQESMAFLKYKKGDFPVTEDIANKQLSLPIYPGLPVEDIDRICNQIKLFYCNQS
jgi:dTDP-4-amino-4,6-dideoxygalactose transaminase